MILIVVILGLACAACFVALWPADWSKIVGERINMMRESITYFVGLMATTLGISMTRGHMDARIEPKVEPQ